MMRIAASLVGLFLVSYMVKLPVLGREDRSLWSTFELWTLYTHELCIFAMLVAGAVAALRARRFGEIRDGPNPAPEAEERDRRLHRIAGRIAVISSLFALLTAAAVLTGMYSRAEF
jgi:uncharacterized iron-regulated membrane protein